MPLSDIWRALNFYRHFDEADEEGEEKSLHLLRRNFLLQIEICN